MSQPPREPRGSDAQRGVQQGAQHDGAQHDGAQPDGAQHDETAQPATVGGSQARLQAAAARPLGPDAGANGGPRGDGDDPRGARGALPPSYGVATFAPAGGPSGGTGAAAVGSAPAGVAVSTVGGPAVGGPAATGSLGLSAVPPQSGAPASGPVGVDPPSATAPSGPDPSARGWREAWRAAVAGDPATDEPVHGREGPTEPSGGDDVDTVGTDAPKGGFRTAFSTGLARARALATGGTAAMTAPAAPSVAGAAGRTAAPATAAGTAMGAAGATTVLPDRAVTRTRPPVAPRAERPRPSRPSARRVRRAHLKLTRVDPWTVMKVSFMLAIAFGIMTIVAVAVVWSMLDAAGVFESLNETVETVTGEGDGALGFDLMSWVAFDRVLGFATLIAVVDVVLITALATLGAFLYNLAASLLGGVEVTFVEDHL